MISPACSSPTNGPPQTLAAKPAGRRTGRADWSEGVCDSWQLPTGKQKTWLQGDMRWRLCRQVRHGVAELLVCGLDHQISLRLPMIQQCSCDHVGVMIPVSIAVSVIDIIQHSSVTKMRAQGSSHRSCSVCSWFRWRLWACKNNPTNPRHTEQSRTRQVDWLLLPVCLSVSLSAEAFSYSS